MHETCLRFTGVPNKCTNTQLAHMNDFSLVLMEHFRLEMVPVTEIFKNIYK